jgi:hypothetical protein
MKSQSLELGTTIPYIAKNKQMREAIKNLKVFVLQATNKDGVPVVARIKNRRFPPGAW